MTVVIAITVEVAVPAVIAAAAAAIEIAAVIHSICSGHSSGSSLRPISKDLHVSGEAAPHHMAAVVCESVTAAAAAVASMTNNQPCVRCNPDQCMGESTTCDLDREGCRLCCPLCPLQQQTAHCSSKGNTPAQCPLVPNIQVAHSVLPAELTTTVTSFPLCFCSCQV